MIEFETELKELRADIDYFKKIGFDNIVAKFERDLKIIEKLMADKAIT